MANWIQNCQICNDGLCIRMEELKKTNLSERQAAKVMMEEAWGMHPELKEEFSADKIRMRYRYHMNGKNVEEFLPIMPAWPMCKKCETHCYAPGYRERIREVMRFSGLYMVKHGRLDLMFHYFF